MPYPAWLGRYTSKRDQVAAVSRSSSEPSIHAGTAVEVLGGVPGGAGEDDTVAKLHSVIRSRLAKMGRVWGLVIADCLCCVVLAGEDVNQFYAGAIGRTGLGPLLCDLFRGTQTALVDVLRRDRIEVCIPGRGVAVHSFRSEAEAAQNSNRRHLLAIDPTVDAMARLE